MYVVHMNHVSLTSNAFPSCFTSVITNTHSCGYIIICEWLHHVIVNVRFIACHTLLASFYFLHALPSVPQFHQLFALFPLIYVLLALSNVLNAAVISLTESRERTIAETVESLEMKRLDWVAESRKSPGFGLSDEPMPITASTISPAIEALAPAGALEYLQPEDHAFAHATSAATSSPTQASRPPPLTSIPSSRHLISSPSSLVASLSTVGMSTPSRSAPVPAPLVSSRSARDLRGAAGSAESSLDAPDLLRDSSIDARCSDPGVALEYAAVDEQRKRLFHNPDDDKLIDVFGADKDEQKKNHSESAASDLKRRKGREDLEAAAEEQSTAEMARMRAEAKAKEEVERRMYAAQGMSRMPFVWPAEKRREVSAITDVLEGIADLLFKPAHGGAGGKGGKSHAAEHTLALRTGIVWLVAALLVPTRILLLVLGTIRFTAELRHKQWRDAYRVSDARVGPKSSKRSNLCVDAEAARVRGLSGSTSLSESLAEPATITIMND